MSNSLLKELTIEHVVQSRREHVDYDNLGFGSYFCDHMFALSYADGQWQNPRIKPFGPVAINPVAGSLHYGQAVFEGLKAFRGSDQLIRVFRADRNYARLQRSCQRLCMPSVPEAAFFAAYRELLRLDHQWVPQRRGEAYYIRPVVFSTEGHLEVRPSRSYEFIVAASPVCNYFGHTGATVSLSVEQRYTRAAPGGMGFAKTGGNYAASLRPAEEARAQGYNQVLWLDGAEHRYIEEVGQMNIFFRFKDKVVTPSLVGTILPGVTRESVLELLADRNIPTEERRIEIDEVIDGITAGDLVEAFGAGTAAVIAPIGLIAYRKTEHRIGDGNAGELATQLHDQLTGIQLGEVEDRFGWVEVVNTSDTDVQQAFA